MSLREQDAPQVAYPDELYQVAQDREGLQPAVDKSEESVASSITLDAVEEIVNKGEVRPPRPRKPWFWILMGVVACVVGIGAGFAIGKRTSS